MRLASILSSLVVCVVATNAFVDAAPAEGSKKPRDPEKVFARKDADKDGGLTLDEFKAGLKDPFLSKASQRFKRLDTNRDGTLSIEEFKEHFKSKA